MAYNIVAITDAGNILQFHQQHNGCLYEQKDLQYHYIMWFTIVPQCALCNVNTHIVSTTLITTCVCWPIITKHINTIGCML